MAVQPFYSTLERKEFRCQLGGNFAGEFLLALEDFVDSAGEDWDDEVVGFLGDLI